MIAFTNQHWWGSINKASKSAYLAFPTCPNTTQGNSLPETLNCLMDHWRFGKCISYCFPLLTDSNMFVMICLFSHWTKVLP